MKNRKGYTIVEVIVSFVLIMIVMIYLLRTVVVLSNKNNDILTYEEFAVYETNFLEKIYNDIDVVYDMESFEGIEASGNEINLKDINKKIKIDKNNNVIEYDGIKYELPDNVTIREKEGNTYKVQSHKSIHSYYVITIYIKVNTQDDEIKIIYQNKNASTIAIKYDGNGGTPAMTTQQGKYGETLTPPTVTWTGHTFKGWFTASEGGTQISSSTRIIEDATYYAHWQTNKVYVQINMNGGSLASSHGSTIGTNGNYVTVNSSKNIHTMNYGDSLGSDGLANYNNSGYINITRTGYHVKADEEYNTNANGSGTTFNQTDNYAASRFCDASVNDCTSTLYVKWLPNTYSVSYALDSGTHGTTHPTSATYDTAFTVNNPSKNVTAKFSLGSSGASANTADITKAYTFSGWTITGMDSVTHTFGTTTSTATTSSGRKETSFKNLRSTSGTVSFTAVWAPPTITLPTITKTGNTCVWTSSGISDIKSGGTYTPATTGGATSRTFTASCSPTKITVTFKANGGTGDDKTQTFTYGTANQKFSAKGYTRTGYTQGKWATSASGTGVYDIESGVADSWIQSNAPSITLYATWTKNNYYIDLNGKLDGTDTGNISGYGTADVYVNGSRVCDDCTDYYTQHPYGSSYEIKDIKATTGHTYNGNSSVSGTIGAGTVGVRLNFTTNTFTVTYNGNGATGGSTSSHTCTYDASCTLKSNGFTRIGYTFNGWKKNNSGSTLSAGSSIKNTVSSGTVAYVAQWKAKTYTFTYLYDDVDGCDSDWKPADGSDTRIWSNTATYNSSYTPTPNWWTCPGWTFSGWLDEYGRWWNPGAQTYDIDRDTKVHAQWTRGSSCYNQCSTTSYSCRKVQANYGTLSYYECYNNHPGATWTQTGVDYGGMGTCIKYTTGTCESEHCSCE